MNVAGHTGAVAVAAVGARTAVGLGADGTAAAVRAGIARLGFHPRFVDKAGEQMRVAMDAQLDPDMPAFARMRALGSSALEEVCESIAHAARPRLSLFVGLPEPRPGWSDAEASPLLQTFTTLLRKSAEVDKILSFPRGHAAGLLALEAAVREIEARRADVCIVGGVDSWLDAGALEWLDADRRLASDVNRVGFTPGEGAAFLLITTTSYARTLGLPTLAKVLGVSSSHEPKSMRTDAICIGEGLTAAIRTATSGLRLPDEKITTTYCDINGERFRSEEFMYVPMRLWAPFVDSNRYDAPADAWGDVGAASGPLLVTLAAVSSRRRWAKGRHVLVWASSDGGTRGAAALALSEAGGGA